VAFRSWGDGAENHEQLEIEPGRRFWLAHTPPAMVAAHFNLSLEDIAKFPNNAPAVMPI
jgi:hypothetical protein